MRSKEKMYTHTRPYISYDMYDDRIETLVPQEDIKAWISTKDISKVNQLDVNGLKYDYIGITKDQSVQKNYLIDGKRVIYTLNVDKWTYLYLQNLEGDDDE